MAKQTAQQEARNRYKAAMSGRGLIQASLVVPVIYRDELADMAQELRERYARKLKRDARSGA